MDNNREKIFAFDLDGTITTTETLPLLAKHTPLAPQIAELTRKTVAGEVPFAESFARRVACLGTIPLNVARQVVGNVATDEHITAFINGHGENSVIITGNIDLWIEPLVKKFPCRVFSSEGFLDEHGCVRIRKIIDKAAVVENLRREAYVVAVGDGAGDTAMLQCADFGIAFAGVHTVPPALVAVADAVADSGEELCKILGTL